MFQTDIVTVQTKTEVNVNGSINITWSDSSTIQCDVQSINKEKVFKEYGLTDANKYKQVFDHTLSALWVEGNQVKWDSQQWWVKLVDDSEYKIGASNHVYIILGKVI